MARLARTRIQLPEPLFHQLERIAEQRDRSLAEFVRRAMTTHDQTRAEPERARGRAMPVLRGSGGRLVDPASAKPQTDMIAARSAKRGHGA